MLVEPDIAPIESAIRFERLGASPRVRVLLVVAWASVVWLCAALPVWLVGEPFESLATISHHLVTSEVVGFIPRTHTAEEFGLGSAVADAYASLRATAFDRGLGVVGLALLFGSGVQLGFARLEGRLVQRREQLAIFGWLIAATLVVRACLLWLPVSATWVPVAALLIPIALQLGTRVGLACTAMLAFAAGAMVPVFDPILALTVGVQGIALSLLAPRRRRAGWRWTAPVVLGCAAAGLVAYLAASWLSGGSLGGQGFSRLEWGGLAGVAIGGLIWPIAGLAIDPVFERAIGNVGRATLLELSDLNHPALQRISTRAPGTWAHSRAMANLAESAAHAVGADALLVRVGAYYHDLGKADEPQFFIENLPRDQPSPHDHLAPERSAAKIIHHVRSSVVRGRAFGLPEPIIDFMHTHHGDGRVEFFYQRARKEALERGEDPNTVASATYSYPGVCPQTRETGILMIVDSVEAASRTLVQPERAAVERLLRQIVFSKLAAGQLDACGLSLADLRQVLETLADALLAGGHDRITYPWQEQDDADGGDEVHGPSSASSTLRVLTKAQT